MEIFSLPKEEFIALYKLLKALNWVASGGEAKQVIAEGKVFVNGEVATQKRKKIRVGDRIAFDGEEATLPLKCF